MGHGNRSANFRIAHSTSLKKWLNFKFVHSLYSSVRVIQKVLEPLSLRAFPYFAIKKAAV